MLALLAVATSPEVKLLEAIGDPKPPSDDPAWQLPRDPLKNIAAQAGVIHREIPLTTIGTGWDVPTVRQALDQVVIGLFDQPAQLVDSLAADSRVQAGTWSRVGGLLGRPVEFQIPRKFADSDVAKECCQAFEDAWPAMATEAFLSELQRSAIFMGFGPAQLLWDTTSSDYAIPHPRFWNPRYTYFHWQYRCYVALTIDGQTPILPGNGHWLLHAPHGDYRGWMHGAMRAIAPWWLMRHYALRDWGRYSERHGLPIIKAKSPSRGDPDQINQWRNDLATLGQETVIQLPQQVDGAASFDVELLEAKDTAHEGFRMLIAACDQEITLSLQAQTLTTSMPAEGGGSYAAARVHADVRQALLEADARALTRTIYTQLARPFAAMNFGDPDIAPTVLWNVEPYEDAKTKADTLLVFTQALVNMRNAGVAPSDVAEIARLGKGLGLDLGKLKEVQAAIAAPGASGKRFEETAAAHARLRIALGETTRAQIEAETEALAAMVAEREQRDAKLRRARR